MCGGSKGQTTSTSAPNPVAGAAYTNILGQAANVAATPYQAYSGELVAGINPEQYQGISGVNQFATAAQPAIGTAEQMATAAASPITAGQIPFE